MVWVAVDKNGKEFVYDYIPCRYNNITWSSYGGMFIELPKGSILKLIGRELTWDDEPVELKEGNK